MDPARRGQRSGDGIDRFHIFCRRNPDGRRRMQAHPHFVQIKRKLLAVGSPTFRQIQMDIYLTGRRHGILSYKGESDGIAGLDLILVKFHTDFRINDIREI